ncbi:hypothetical protein CO725_01080 [Vibrio parahaemolyticus]|uniref:hypothetical protein n=1 Tax=Vibrio parahaemolyticus TaxID=670 RepID=UPI000BE25710|nr:hypothetical protein [Vibrio parahaemolyticus]ATI44280.1 hypothetical protein CO725_01080 [Vibrio parahaemolyticus]
MNEIFQVLDSLPVIIILLCSSLFYHINFGFTSALIMINKFKIGFKGWGAANQKLLDRDQKVLTVSALLILIINSLLVVATGDPRCLVLNIMPCICIIMTITDSIFDGTISIYDKCIDFLSEREERLRKEYFNE